MIGKLKGLVDTVEEDSAIVDVGGVGYLVFASGRTLRSLPGEGEAAVLVIETHVREDHIHLYGFADTLERDWFRLLTTVQGVGAKAALAILSVLEPDALANAIAAEDRTAISRANGVGPKLAGRVISELKEKVPAIPTGSMPAPGGKEQPPAAFKGNLENEALSALAHLGYSRSEALAAIARARQELGDAVKVEDLVKLSLQELAVS